MKKVFIRATRLLILNAVLILFFTSKPAFAQTGVKISTSPGTAHSSAMLDVESINKGVLVPRMTAAQRGAITGPAEGLIVYQTDAPSGYWYFNGSVWIQMGVGAISGAGTTNFVPKWNTANSLGNSSITDDGTSVTTSGQFDVTGGTGTSYSIAPIEIRTTSTPRLAFHWPGVVASQIGMDAAGVIRTYDNPGTGYERFAAGSVTVNGQITITGGSPGAGKVLTSDGSGLATWAAPALGADNLGNHTATTTLNMNGNHISGVGTFYSGTSGWSANQLHYSSGWGAAGYHATIGSGYTGISAAGIMLGNPHVPWRPGYGAKERFASDQPATNYWDWGMNGEAGGSTDRFDLNRNNTNLLTITNIGRVGMGTNAPAAKLQVSAGDASYALFGPNSTWNSYLYVGAGANTVSSGRAQVLSTNGNLHLDAGTTQNIYIANYTGSNTFMQMGGGNVGIGTTSPGFKLHVPSGYIGADYINTTDNTVTSGVTGVMVKTGDNFYRTATAAALASFLGGSGFIPNNGSGDWQIASSSTSTGYGAASLELRESNFTNNGTATPPHLGFHWGGVVASNIAIESSGRIAIRDNPGTGYENFIARDITISGVVPCIQGNCPSNSAIRLTPNLHLNSNAAHAVILNWDNGSSGNSSVLRIGNGASSDVFQVWASQGKTGINIAPEAAHKLIAYDADYTVGSSYDRNGSRSAVSGVDLNVQTYEFGTSGHSYNDYTRCGGVLGAQWSASYWGSLGYKNSGSTGYGAYYTSVGSGGGYLPENISTGIGSGGYGGVIGSWSRGDVMGQVSSGELFASYNLGNEYTSGHQAEIVNVGEKRVAAYSVTSTDVKVYGDGEGTLNGTSVFVPFEKDYAQILGSKPRVTVTPMGSSAAIFIKSIEKNGFTVASDNAVNVQFSWIAVGKRIDAESKPEFPADLADKNFDANMKGVMFNENNKEQSATPVWYDGQKVRFDKAPEVKIDKKEDTQSIADAKAQSGEVNKLIESAAQKTEPAPLMDTPEDNKK